MNRNSIALAAAAIVLVSGQAFATDVAHWSPDAGAAAAFPALAQPQGAGRTVAEVRAELRSGTANQAAVSHWAPDARTADAYPALQRATAVAGRSRDEVRAEAKAVTAQRLATLREPLKFGS